MIQPLTEFLVSLADPDAIKKYSNDPEGYMTEVGLSEQCKQAVRSRDLYRIRRLCAREMKDSLHGQLLTRFYEEKDSDFTCAVELGPTDLDDVTAETDHNIVETTD